MTVTIELTASEFSRRCWSGAADTCKYLTLDEIRDILHMLDDNYNSGKFMSLTEVNDFFWFERDIIAEWLGYENFDYIIDKRD